MDVILLERVQNLGQMGDVVKVRTGFARNYLLPQKKALRATKENLARFERQRVELEAVNLHRRQEAEKVSERVEGTVVSIIRQAGESGQLYGSVSARDITDALAEEGFKVDRSQVAIDRPIKSIGLFDVRVNLHPEVSCRIVVNVARSTEEADLQAERGGLVTSEDLEAAREAEQEAGGPDLSEIGAETPAGDVFGEEASPA
ncbi:MAG: 50S ribosomal protein L9 [Alphaproteobacteria bacterium]|jgi:large subunit ribosomal protein L9|nr:50S ribosomal protein L9 [Alphaproteobacteria bacterium]